MENTKEELENTVEYTKLNNIIRKIQIVNGKFRDGRRFRFIPTEDIEVFDNSVTDAEWDEYLINRELDLDSKESCELRTQILVFEAKHKLGTIPKGSPDWKHIFIRFSEQHPEDI